MDCSYSPGRQYYSPSSPTYLPIKEKVVIDLTDEPTIDLTIEPVFFDYQDFGLTKNEPKDVDESIYTNTQAIERMKNAKMTEEELETFDSHLEDQVVYFKEEEDGIVAEIEFNHDKLDSLRERYFFY